VRCWICWILTLSLVLARPLPVWATSCRSLNGELVCIQSIQRSAQKYWEYRVQFKIAGLSQPLKIYDCRSRRKRTSKGQWQDFSEGEIDAFA
jgi:hypothetical protein